MDDLKQWLKRGFVIVAVLFAVQLAVIIVMLIGGKCVGGENCAGGGFSCPKERGCTLEDVPYTNSAEELKKYYGWDYLIFVCGWSRMLNDAIGCRFEEMESNSIFSPEKYNFISFGGRMQSGRLDKNVPLIRCSYGDSYGELVLPFAGFTCEYGNIGCAGCYDCGLRGCDSEE